MSQDDQKLKATKTEQAVLDAYFSTRQPSGGNMTGVMVEERKTTLQIQDDLLPTLKIEDVVIVDYMLHHEYMLMQDDDGTPIWQMFRLR